MPVIGTFTPTKDGGWQGTIRTLTIDIQVRLVPNDNQESERAPAFRICAGNSEVGAAWRERSAAEQKEYYRVQLDDPSLAKPVVGAMFEASDGREAYLIWGRRRGRGPAHPIQHGKSR